MTIEAIYIKKLKPQINTRDEYRGRELTLKYLFKYKNLTFEIHKIFWYMLIRNFVNPKK